MATLDLNSLFGQDPRLLQQSMDLQMAKLSPEERLYMMGAQGGRAIGQGLGSLFGVDVEDPTIKKASALRALASEYDTTTADGLMQYAQAASKIDPRIGMLVSQQVQDMRAKQAAISKDEAAAQASLSGRTPADIQKAQRIAALKKAIPAYKEAGDTDTVKMLEDELEALTPADKTPSYGTDAERISKALFGTTFNKLNPTQAARVNDEVQKQDLLAKATGAAKQTVINSQETAFAKERGQLQAKTLAETETQAKASANAVNRLASMEKLNQGKMLTGPMAGTAIGAGQFLSSVGLLSPDAAKTLASSEVYDKLAKDLVMQDLGGKLGAQISNADREFIEARIPQLRNSQEARTELITKLKEIHKKNIDYYQRMSKHANTKGNLNDFDFSSGTPDSGPALGTKENPIKLQ